MLQDGNKQILDQFWTSWIAFDASGNHGLVYFTQMLSYRCAIKEVRYGFNGGSLEKAIDMPACNEKDPYAIPDNYLPYFKVGDDIAVDVGADHLCRRHAVTGTRVQAMTMGPRAILAPAR